YIQVRQANANSARKLSHTSIKSIGIHRIAIKRCACPNPKHVKAIFSAPTVIDGTGSKTFNILIVGIHGEVWRAEIHAGIVDIIYISCNKTVFIEEEGTTSTNFHRGA